MAHRMLAAARAVRRGIGGTLTNSLCLPHDFFTRRPLIFKMDDGVRHASCSARLVWAMAPEQQWSLKMKRQQRLLLCLSVLLLFPGWSNLGFSQEAQAPVPPEST